MTCFFIVSYLKGQDIHYSQVFNSLLNNPAEIGNSSDYAARINLSSRVQWSKALKKSAFKTTIASYDQRIAIGKQDFLGFGGIISTDKAGSANLKSNLAGIGISLLKHLNTNRYRNSFLVLGVFGSWNERRFDESRLLFGNQIETGGISRENILQSRIQYFDAGIGLQFWDSPIYNKRYGFKLGGAYWHINTQKLDFLQTDGENIHPRLLLQASGLLKISPRDLLPVFLIGSVSWEKQGNAQKLLPHLKLRVDLPSHYDQAFLQFGTGTRLVNAINTPLIDAIFLSTTVSLQQVQVGLIYDINISPLASATQQVGSIEVNFKYFIEVKERRSVYCPNF